MLQASAQLLTARVFAAVVILSAFAIALFGLLRARARASRGGGRAASREPDRRSAAARSQPRWSRSRPDAARSRSRATARRRAAAVRPRARLLRQPRPRRASTRRSIAATSTDAGLDVKPHVPSDPSAPIKQVAAGRPTSRSPTSPRCCSPATQGLDVVAVGALVQEPLTSLISLPEAGIRVAPRPRRQDDRHRRDPVPDRVPRVDPGTRRRWRPTTSSEVDVGLDLLPALLGGRADAMLGGFQQRRGRRPRRARRGPERRPGRRARDPDLRRARPRRERRPRRRRPRGDPRSSSRRWRAARATPSATPRRPPQTLLDAAPDLDPKLTPAEVDATLPLLEPERGDPYGYMNVGQWQQFAGFMKDAGLIESLPEVGDVADQRAAAGAPAVRRLTPSAAAPPA